MSMDALVHDVLSRLAENKRVRRTLPDGGRLHIDRPLPFLCLYRYLPNRKDTGTRELVKGEASFLIAETRRRTRPDLARLVTRVAEAMSHQFGAFLIVEIWSAPDRDVAVAADQDDIEPTELRPDFALYVRRPAASQRTLDTLRTHLQRVTILRQSATVQTVMSGPAHPPGMNYMLNGSDAARFHCDTIGICVRPIYRDHKTGEVFPTVLRSLRQSVGRSLKHTFFTFAKTKTNVSPVHYYALGRRAMVKAVWDVDRRLAQIGDSFDFLLQVTPANAEAAWREFRRSKFQQVPRFYYPPLAVEPARLKRLLHEVKIENIEDPTLGDLFRQRQDELDRKITMLKDIDTPRFVLGSRQVFGEVRGDVLALARELLHKLPARSRDESRKESITADEFAAAARAEIGHYRALHPPFNASAVVRSDLFSGLICSGGNLLIGHKTTIPRRRVLALLQHEVGTHLVTYYNGMAQPFQQLHSGFAGYDALQEGLAVLTEYLVGGLSAQRLRRLAARVVAVNMLIAGATFLDTFHTLVHDHGFMQRIAYTITMRAYRGGGLTKDAVYLHGLVKILDYLRRDGQLDPLFVGKIAAEHIPLIRELQLRKVLTPPAVRPRYLDLPGVAERLNKTRTGMSVTDLAVIRN